MFFSFRQWVRRLTRARRPIVRSRPARRLVCEYLEDRTLPSITLLTDKPDYMTGQLATFTANALRLGETVQFRVLHTDGTPNTGAGHLPWKVTDGVTTPAYVDAQGVLRLPDLDGTGNKSIQTSWLVTWDDSF